MQTFLPYPNFDESARVLDRQRLGKQRVEVLQILRALLVPGSGWANHPTVRMWVGHEDSLVGYGTAVCVQWKRRGYRDSCLDKMLEFDVSPSAYRGRPSWLGDPAFHASHRSNLLRKNPGWYGRFGWSEPDDLPYVWPVSGRGV